MGSQAAELSMRDLVLTSCFICDDTPPWGFGHAYDFYKATSFKKPCSHSKSISMLLIVLMLLMVLPNVTYCDAQTRGDLSISNHCIHRCPAHTGLTIWVSQHTHNPNAPTRTKCHLRRLMIPGPSTRAQVQGPRIPCKF